MFFHKLFDEEPGLFYWFDLKKCFPDTYKQILSTAYYLVLEDRNPLSRFPKWAATHRHPYGKNIPSQRSSELFASITEDSRAHFFRLQGKRRVEQEYWAYDTTSVSSYSKCLSQIRYGVNKDHEPLQQINIALFFGEESNIPFYYRKLAGNIPDVKTVKNLLEDVDFLAYDKIKLIPLREVHAIRLMLNDENKNLSYNARSKKVKDTVQPIIEEYGFKVTDRADYTNSSKQLPKLLHENR